MQNAIQEAEPAIACIVVSRSEDYLKLGETPPPDGSGKLGGFNSARATQKFADIMKRNPDDREKGQLDRLDLANPSQVPDSYGSGVVVDETGLILTNEHVVREATKIFVRLPGGKGSYADIHAADPRSDLAVLRLLSPLGRLKTIKLGNGGKARKGQWVLSLANAFAAGFRDGSPSASWGIVSNIRRRPLGSPNELDQIKPLYQHGILLQTDVRLNVGCSGGALIDLKGELIGLTTALASINGTETAGGYALPIDDGMKRIIEVLKRGEEVEYGFLGVHLSKDLLPQPGGVRIGGAVEASPAARAGLRPGDVILSVGGVPINDYDDLFLAVSTVLAGNEVRVEVGQPGFPSRTVTVTLDKFYVPGKVIAARKPPAPRGLRVDYLSVLMQTLHPSAYPRGITFGVVVREVQSNSAASNALLKVNDIITHIKGQPVRTPAEFYRRMQTLSGPVDLTLPNAQQVMLN
jgi:serine protease Do